MRIALWGLLACCACPTLALSHTRSESYSNWQVSGTTVRVAFTVPDTEARRLAPPGTTMPSADQLGDYLAARIGVSAAGRPCARTAGPDRAATLPGVARYEFVFECPQARALKLRSSAFFELVPTHTHLAQIQSADGTFFEQLITRDHQTLDLAATAGGALQNASLLRYVALGILHIFTGVDHQAFLLGLILLSRRLRDLVFVVTGFTLGHSATLALAVTGVLRPHAEYIDALIGLTIALVGAECIAQNTHRPAIVAIGIGTLLLAMAAGKLLGSAGCRRCCWPAAHCSRRIISWWRAICTTPCACDCWSRSCSASSMASASRRTCSR